jgi:hypothetical protein
MSQQCGSTSVRDSRAARWHEIGTAALAAMMTSRQLLALVSLALGALSATRASAMTKFTQPMAGPGNASALIGSSPPVTYAGGPVIVNAEVVSVFWGPSVASTITQQVGGFYASFVDSNELDWLCEYATPTQTIGRGSFGHNFTITPSISATNITDAAIGDEIAAQINAGHLPQPDANTVYVLQFPPFVVITEPGGTNSCMAGGYCAYHGYWTRTIAGVQSTLLYVVMPDFASGGCASGCGDRAVFANFTKTVAHEITETITDPIVGTGWIPEIGDPCNYSVIGEASYAPFVGKGGIIYYAQTEWSQRASSCVGGGPCMSQSAAVPATTVAHVTALSAFLFLASAVALRPLRRRATTHGA